MMGGGFKRKSKPASEIPSSSLADIAFLLLIFFMVSTTFRKEQDRDVAFPEADATERLDEPRKNILHVFVEQDGRVFINDVNVPMQQVSQVVQPLYEENRELVIVLRADAEARYASIDAVQKELQEANAVRVTFYTNLEQRMTRERR
jgi:biopolymer transport protein ExbD